MIERQFSIPAETPQWRAMFAAAEYLARYSFIPHKVVRGAGGGWEVFSQQPIQARWAARYAAIQEEAYVLAQQAFAEAKEGIDAHLAWVAEQRSRLHPSDAEPPCPICETLARQRAIEEGIDDIIARRVDTMWDWFIRRGAMNA